MAITLGTPNFDRSIYQYQGDPSLYYKDASGNLQRIASQEELNKKVFQEGYNKERTVLTPNANVNTSTANSSPLSSWKNHTSFIEDVKGIIQKKQAGNEDISAQRRYWNTLEKSSIMPFGGAQTKEYADIVKNANPYGTMSDKDLRMLSPEQQSSLQSSRLAAAQAWKGSLSDEEKYRETRTEDMVKVINDNYENRLKELQIQQADANEKESLRLQAERDKISAERDRILNLKDKTELGLATDAIETFGSFVSSDGQRVGFKQGGTAAWRNNNPLNIKYGDFAKKYGAVEGSKATDGGSFAAFTSEEEGLRAAKDLLRGKTYGNLDPNTAMLRWSGGLTNGKPNGKGYTYDKLVRNYGLQGVSISKLSQLSDAQLDELIKAMAKAEGWKEGTILTGASSTTQTAEEKAFQADVEKYRNQVTSGQITVDQAKAYLKTDYGAPVDVLNGLFADTTSQYASKDSINKLLNLKARGFTRDQIEDDMDVDGKNKLGGPYSEAELDQVFGS